MDRKERTKIQNIHHALAAAVSSINLAKRLLSELELASGSSSRDLPGELGKFDGHFMVSEGGEKCPIPENYASKSQLVYGDTLKRIADEGGEVFKQIERVKRQEVEGILAQKDGQWHVVTSLGSYEVLSAAVNYWGGRVGEEAIALIPQQDTRVPFAALKSVHKEEAKAVVAVRPEESPVPVVEVEEKKPKRRARKPRKEEAPVAEVGTEAKAAPVVAVSSEAREKPVVAISTGESTNLSSAEELR